MSRLTSWSSRAGEAHELELKSWRSSRASITNEPELKSWRSSRAGAQELVELTSWSSRAGGAQKVVELRSWRSSQAGGAHKPERGKLGAGAQLEPYPGGACIFKDGLAHLWRMWPGPSLHISKRGTCTLFAFVVSEV